MKIPGVERAATKLVGLCDLGPMTSEVCQEQIAAYSHVITKHTASDKVLELCEQILFPVRYPPLDPRITKLAREIQRTLLQEATPEGK